MSGPFGLEYEQQCADIETIDALIKQHEDKQHIGHCGGRADKLKAILAEYSNRAADVIAGSKSFRDELLVSARALSLVVQMAGNASTHREKDARLRGMAELLETWIGQLERERFEWLGNNGRFSPILACDFPTRHFKERIFELEQRFEQLRQMSSRLQCACTPSERESGHKSDCWFPELEAVFPWK